MTKLKASDIIEIDEAFLNEVSLRIEQRKKADSAERAADRPTLYTTDEVAGIVNKDVATIRMHIRNYHEGLFDKPYLEAEKHGKNWLITQDALMAYINTRPNQQRP